MSIPPCILEVSLYIFLSYKYKKIDTPDIIKSPQPTIQGVSIMVKIISVLSVFLKYLNKLLYKFILFLDSYIISTPSSKSSSTYYEPFRKFTVDGEPIIQKIEKLDYFTKLFLVLSKYTAKQGHLY